MDAEQIQAIHSLIDDLQSAADTATGMMIHAPEFSGSLAAAEGTQFDVGDFVQGSSSGGTWRGVVIDVTTDGTFSERIRDGSGEQADQSVEGTEDDPAYLIQVMQERDDGWVPGQARPAHQESSVDSWDVSESSIAELPSSMEGTRSFTAQIEAADPAGASADGLKGIVWASGQHDLWVNGEPTSVHVPEDTISDTFDRLQARMQAERSEVKIGFDHPDDDSVAAQTALGEIGVAQEFSQDSVEGREAITMRESEFTNSKAVEAAEAGSFEDVGFSIVGNIALATGSDGQPKKRDDGALQVAATEIHRVDVVPDQAVEGAKNGNLPELAAAAEAAGRMAASSPNQAPDGFVRTLRAAAGSIEADTDQAEANTSHMTDGDFPTDPEDLDAAKAALNQASDTVEAKQEQVEDLEAEVSDLQDQADHFRQIAASQGVDPDSDDFEAQDVVDAFTEDLRAEIADLEAALPKFDTEDRESRQEDLAGKPISELEAMAGERWRQFGRSKAKRDELSAAVAADESVGSVESAGSGGSQEDADQAAKGVLRARELAEASDAGQSPAEYVDSNYGIEASEYDSERELQAKMSGGAN
jgi:hypothetical protein